MDKIRKQPVDWKGIYKEASKNVWEPKPHKFSILATSLVSEGYATDLGSGEGYDAMHFAEQGFTTTAIDISEMAIESLSRQAKESGLSVQAELKDVRSVELARPQSLLASYGVLHFLGASFEERMNHFKDMTIEDGVHSIYTFGNKGDFYDIGKHNYWFPDLGELKSVYKDWNIKRIEEKDVELLITGDKGETLHNSLLKVLAQKRSTN